MKTFKKSIKILGLAIVVTSVHLLVVSPWWIGIVPAFCLGLLVAPGFWEKGVFLSGFLAGALSWGLPLVYFGMCYEGNVQDLVSGLINLPYVLVVLLTSIIGGILSGLALVSGVQLRRGREEVKLEL